MLAFALSFDEVIVTTFTAGQQETLPIWIFSQLTQPRQRPVTNVVAVLVIAVTLVPILLAHRLTRPGRADRGGRRQVAKGASPCRPNKASSDPATGEAIEQVPSSSAAEVDAAVTALRPRSRAWRRATPPERSLLLLQLADRVERDGGTPSRLESLNCGKPHVRVLKDEMPAIVDCFRFFAGAARCVPALAAGEYLPGHTSMIRRDPVGVVAQIAPWNYPLMMAAWKLARPWRPATRWSSSPPSRRR